MAVDGFSGKVAVVTGGASGIGLALGRRLLDEGATVVLSDVEMGVMDAVRAELEGRNALVVPADVSDAASVDELARETIDRFGRVDLLFNNAGVSTFNPIRAQTLDDWRWVIDVNLWGVIHGVRTFLPILRDQGGPAHIVNTASIAGVLSGVPCLGPYALTKVGVVSISETLRIELESEQSPIGVSVLCPGNTATAVMEAERNRPSGREVRTEEGEGFRVAVRESMTGPTGQSADEVAAKTLDGVRAGRFWIFTHPEMKPILEARLREMLDSYPSA